MLINIVQKFFVFTYNKFIIKGDQFISWGFLKSIKDIEFSYYRVNMYFKL